MSSRSSSTSMPCRCRFSVTARSEAGRRQYGADLLLVPGDVLQVVAHKGTTRSDALAEGGIRVRLGQEGDAVAQAEIHDAEPWQGGVGFPVLAIRGEIAVEERVQM